MSIAQENARYWPERELEVREFSSKRSEEMLLDIIWSNLDLPYATIGFSWSSERDPYRNYLSYPMTGRSASQVAIARKILDLSEGSEDILVTITSAHPCLLLLCEEYRTDNMNLRREIKDFKRGTESTTSNFYNGSFPYVKHESSDSE